VKKSLYSTKEEMQRLTDKSKLSELLATQCELEGAGGMADNSVAQAAKRASVNLTTRIFHFLLVLY
jgi:hypothetical protein